MNPTDLEKLPSASIGSPRGMMGKCIQVFFLLLFFFYFTDVFLDYIPVFPTDGPSLCGSVCVRACVRSCLSLSHPVGLSEVVYCVAAPAPDGYYHTVTVSTRWTRGLAFIPRSGHRQPYKGATRRALPRASNEKL